MSVSDRLPVPNGDVGTSATETVVHRLEILETPEAMSILGTLAWSCLFLAAFADLFTTTYGLGMGAQETNPVGRFLIVDHGLVAAGVLKLGVISVVAFGSGLVYAVERQYKDRKPVWWLYYPALAAPVWMGAAAWNAIQITGAL